MHELHLLLQRLAQEDRPVAVIAQSLVRERSPLDPYHQAYRIGQS